MISGFQVKLCIMGVQNGEERTSDLYMGSGTLDELMYNYEKQIILEVMEKCGTISATAARLGVNKSTISRKVKAYKIKDAANGGI